MFSSSFSLCVFAAKFSYFYCFRASWLGSNGGTGGVDGSDGRYGCLLQVVSCRTVQMEINNCGPVSVKQSMLTCTGEALAAMLVSALVNTQVLAQTHVSPCPFKIFPKSLEGSFLFFY